jgi:ABC-type nitrate/sulfonate/bicarbonate transport system substrate-binding protein
MVGEGTEMVTFRFLHRVTLKIIATFLALTAAQASEVVNLGVSNYNKIIPPYFVAVEKGYFRDEGIELTCLLISIRQ